MPSLVELFLTFFRIGLLTFGGGLVMVEVIRKELHDRKHWVSLDDFLDDLSIGTSLPGPFIVNLAMMVGYRLRRTWGALAATLGVVLPSFAVIILASLVLRYVPESQDLRAFFKGARAAVVAVLVYATMVLASHILTTVKVGLLTGFTLCLVAGWDLHPLSAIGISIVGSFVLRADLQSSGRGED